MVYWFWLFVHLGGLLLFVGEGAASHLALEHRELMTKNHELDVVVQVAGRAGHEP